jgi:dTDP-4-amino-4,6-dideoxygalactose transaminase
MWKIPLFDLSFDEQEKAAVNEVLESKWLTSGPKTKEFEEKFAQFLGANIHASAVSSGTAALHIALMLLDLQEKDEIIISGLSFVAALNVVTLCNATPILADSNSLEDWNISIDEIRTKITNRTKAIIIVHYAGYPCEMDEIVEICDQNNITLIEDVAHAIGARYKGKYCGTFGDVACFSFFSNKNLSVGEGGMVVTKHEGLYRKINLLRSHGMTSMTIDRHEGRNISYDVLQPGLNYRLDEIRSALGTVQLSKLEINNKKRGRLTSRYNENLKRIKNIIVPWQKIQNHISPAYHIFTILLPENTDRLSIINFLKDRGIQTSIHYPAYNQFSYYQSLINEDLPIANQISERVLTLPLYPAMKDDEIDYVCDCMYEFFESSGKNENSAV